MTNLNKFNLTPIQTKALSLCTPILEAHKFVYLVLPPRRGKTRVGLALSSGSVLVVTKKNAIGGWKSEAMAVGVDIVVINYESLHKVPSQTWDTVILDEGHVLGAYPVSAKKVLEVYKIKRDRTVILSATPFAESISQLFHQLRSGRSGLWLEFKNFYDWHRNYGIASTRYMYNRVVADYSKCQEVVLDEFREVSVTLEDRGAFKEPIETLIEGSIMDSEVYDLLVNDNYVERGGWEVLADTVLKIAQKCHQVTGGTLITESGDAILLDGGGKVDLCRNACSGYSKIVVFYVYAAEKVLLRDQLGLNVVDSLEELSTCSNGVFLAQYKAFSEGIDMSMADTLIIYSMSFSTTNYLQARDRMNRLDRLEAMPVQYLVTSGIDLKIYETVVLKNKDFKARMFKSSHKRS